jgi:hypothetical protein
VGVRLSVRGAESIGKQIQPGVLRGIQWCIISKVELESARRRLGQEAKEEVWEEKDFGP